MHDAAQLWAIARNTGKPTADNTALDGDMILCAQARSLKLAASDYAVATTNTKHLTVFIHAAPWQNVLP